MLLYAITSLRGNDMKAIISLIDFNMIHEGKKTLRYIKKASIKDTDRPVSRCILLIKPDGNLDVNKSKEYSEMFDRILAESNKEYLVVRDRGSLDKPLILIQQQETHALWREFKLTMGSSANQVKPVRILDAPIKQKFFFGLLEPGQEVPDLYFMKKK